MEKEIKEALKAIQDFQDEHQCCSMQDSIDFIKEEFEILEHNLKVCRDFSDRGFDFSLKMIEGLDNKIDMIKKVVDDCVTLVELQYEIKQILDEC